MRPVRDFEPYVGTLPYASEIFGVYQPLIGWRSRRKLVRMNQTLSTEREHALRALRRQFRPSAEIEFNQDHVAEIVRLEPGAPVGAVRFAPAQSLLVQALQADLDPAQPPDDAEWVDRLERGRLTATLHEQVFPTYRDQAFRDIRNAMADLQPYPREPEAGLEVRRRELARSMERRVQVAIDQESALAGVLAGLAEQGLAAAIRGLLYTTPADGADLVPAMAHALTGEYDDPYLTFDPKKDVEDVSVSPLGIVHLFRQYFFEFDTFLGTPVAHVWLAPGSTVELIEVSTRKQTTERTTSSEFETTSRSERSSQDQDEISRAIKQENRNDTKLGVSATVNQSWATGDASATASLNLDSTQSVAREQTHKHMRQQTEKVSSELRQKLSTTFRTVTETTDTSSRRYVLSNPGNELTNYELRRKMRQVGIQVQDIGTYLCWETFVDEPGADLGLAQLVHIAKPADLQPQPDQKAAPYPPDLPKVITANAAWDFPEDKRQFSDAILGFKELASPQVSVQLDPGYELSAPDGFLDLSVVTRSGEGSEFLPYWRGKLVGGQQIKVGPVLAASGFKWDKRMDYVLSGVVWTRASAAKRAEIDAANTKLVEAQAAATRADARASTAAFATAAKERIEQAAAVEPRPYQDLREEERTVVYRHLIRSLMSAEQYDAPASAPSGGGGPAGYEARHVLSELIKSVFDVDKMLYFVAPEWWKPRATSTAVYGSSNVELPLFGSVQVPLTASSFDEGSLVQWSDTDDRESNYLITKDSQPARLGSSLGWLLQLDGDDLRNAFLNAPWVKAVIPVRPGRELAAIRWLQNVGVEGSDGLDHAYAAAPEELESIRAQLLAADPDDEVAEHPDVTLSDAIRVLCMHVSSKHRESLQVQTFPKGVGVHDDMHVSATPVDRVYEHGFYPLQGSFRVNPADPDPNNPDPNFQINEQWVEVLPTDQIVPVEVTYDPKTGRQL